MRRRTTVNMVNPGLECGEDKETDRHYQGQSTGRWKLFLLRLGCKLFKPYIE